MQSKEAILMLRKIKTLLINLNKILMKYNPSHKFFKEKFEKVGLKISELFLKIDSSEDKKYIKDIETLLIGFSRDGNLKDKKQFKKTCGLLINQIDHQILKINVNSERTNHLAKTNEIDEIEKVLGNRFEKEILELKISLKYQPDCTAFLMRKILEKLLFIIISKSDCKNKIIDYKKNNHGKLPPLKDLLNWAQIAEINNIHIATPRNVRNIQGSKFLGDTAAHNYLVNVDFEDIKPEMPNWRILIKELSKSL